MMGEMEETERGNTRTEEDSVGINSLGYRNMLINGYGLTSCVEKGQRVGSLTKTKLAKIACVRLSNGRQSRISERYVLNWRSSRIG